ncbi:FIP1 [Euphorbia peplus]|nr:FIP1 [Euphorbia peplus]
MGDMMYDDFGDIYTDVECRASSSINVVQEEGEEKGGECNFDTSVNAGENPSEKSSNSESDSEDDFNIVLNDEDCKGFSGAAERGVGAEDDEEEDGPNSSGIGHRGEQGNGVNDGYQHKLKQYGSLFPNNQINQSVGGAPCSSKSARGPWEDNRCKQHEVSNTGQVASIRSSSNFVASHGGYGFSLPWNRTILDVNIDAFEEKRWRYSGVDISDFFNFGFDEDSWKRYCISLEQLRQQLYLHNRFHNHDFSHLTQACDIKEAESGRPPESSAQVGSSSKFSNTGEKRLELPKGRAIQVEDGSGERQSKMDIRCPRIWDSDVVIQINVQDPRENCSGSGEDKFDHTDNFGLESSTDRNLNMDDVRDVKDSDSSSADESLEDFRSSKTNLAPGDPHEDHKVDVQTSEEISEATETVKKVEEENGKTICKSDQQLTEIEVSVGERSHLSLTLSCSESESEASEDTVYNLPEASHRFLSRQSSVPKLLESDASDRKSPKRNVPIKKQDNRQHCSRRRSPTSDRRRHLNRRLHNVSRGRKHPDIYSDASPMNRDNLSIDNCRQMERIHDFGYHNRHNFSRDQPREFSDRHDFSRDQPRELSDGYSGEKFAKVYNRNLHGKDTRLRYNHSFRSEVEPQQRRNWTEENFHERHIWFDDKEGLSEDWDSGERSRSPRGMSSLTYGKSRRLHSKHKNLNDSNIQWRRKRDRFESVKQTDDEGFLLDHENEDYAMLRKYGRSLLFNSKRESFNDKYENHIHSTRKEAYLCERRDRYDYSPPMNLENPWCMEIEDGYWDLDTDNLSYWHHKEPYAGNNRRLSDKMSPRSDICDPRLAERYGQELDCGKYRDGNFVESYNDCDDIEGDIVYTGDQADIGWRKYSWKSRILHEVECESILRQQDDISYRSSVSYENSSRHERFQSNYRSTGDIQLESRRFKMFKGDTNASFISRKPHMTFRGEHDPTAWRYSNPAGLICGEGKSSGRRMHGANTMANGKHELTDQKFVKEQKGLRDFSGTQTRRAIGDRKDDDKPPFKFPGTAWNGNLDIEEGQIVSEKLIREERPEIKNVGTKDAVDKGYDEQQIQATLAKMERRRQRFQDPITSKKETEPQTDSVADTLGKKQERPARKRQWGGGS